MEREIKAATIVVFLAIAVITMLSMRPFGAPADSRMDGYFIRNSQEETGSNNVVTSVVFDYRALDTLGETTVLFAAVCGIFIVFLGGKKR